MARSIARSPSAGLLAPASTGGKYGMTSEHALSFVEHCGCRLAYRLEGKGPPVLWIQGTAIHGYGWRPQIDELRAEYQCLSFDNRGMFSSMPVGARVTIEQMAEDARILMDTVGWETAHVVGHSLGGVIALELALSAPQRVRSLALMCTAANAKGLVQMDGAMIWRGLRMSVGRMNARRRAFLEIVLSPEEHAAANTDELASELESIFGHDLAITPRGTSRQISAMRRYDSEHRLSELEGMPVLVVGARHDVIARPTLVRRLADGIPGSQFVEFESGHGVPVTHPAEVNARLRQHFTSVAQ